MEKISSGGKMYSVEQYIKCINKLKKPYPEDYLEMFLKGYIENFTRHTSPNHIFFDGKSRVDVQIFDGLYMLDGDIEDMLLFLLKYHKKGSDIHKIFIKFIESLSAMVDVDRPDQKLEIETFQRGELDFGPDLNFETIQNEVQVYQRDELQADQTETFIIREPTASIYQRWQVNISGKGKSFGLIKKLVEKLINSIPEIYKINMLKDERLIKEDQCSKVVLYIETEELNIQNILDRMHNELDKSVAKKILPCGPCDSHIPAFSASVSAIVGKTKHNCIFSFSQGDEELDMYRSDASASELSVFFDGYAHYKIFGTLDVSIDINKYIAIIDMIDQGAKIMKDIGRYEAKLVDQIIDKGYLENMFTHLLFTESISIKEFRQIASTGIYKHKHFLHGVDSVHPIVFIMKSNFEKSYKNKAVVPSIHSDKKAKIDPNREASSFTFRYPKTTDGSKPCKDNLTWCNHRISIGGQISLYDIDTVLIPWFLYQEFDNLNKIHYIPESNGNKIPNPFFNRLIFYGEDTSKDNFLIRGKEAFKISMAPVPDSNYYLSYNPFVDIQMHYMKRLAYYGLFKDSNHQFI